MSCDAVSALFLYFAAANGAPASLQPAVAPAVTAPMAGVASEPLFAGIVDRAKTLKSRVDFYREAIAESQSNDLPSYDIFKKSIGELSELDMKGHLELAARGTDGDLKCILRGISQDLMVKMDDLDQAKDVKSRDTALKEMAYLLNDNVEVITAPPAPPV